MLEENSLKVEKVISLEVEDDELINRLLLRGRSDDNRETITNRLEVYKKQTLPIKNYYSEFGLLIEIKGDDSIEEVFNNIITSI
jgi:adenylate kinase